MKTSIFLVTAAVLLSIPSFAKADRLVTVAGGGTSEPAVGLSATDIALDSYSHRVDRNGNLYIADDDYGNNTLIGRGFIKVNPWGKVDRVFIDTSATSWIDDMTIDGAGNVFLAVHNYTDEYDDLHKITPDGTVTSCASVPGRVETVDADLEGNVFIGTWNSENNKIYKVDGKTCSGTPVEIYSQADRFDSFYADGLGNVYAFSPEEHRIKKITAQGSVINIAGNGTEGYWGDGENATIAQIGSVRGITGDIWGNIYISDRYSDEYIRKIDTNGIITTVSVLPAYSGSARLSADNDGMVYITNYPSSITSLRFSPILASAAPAGGGIGGAIGEKVILSGRYFGSRGIGGTVTFNGVPAEIQHWSNEAIICTVPQGATTGNLVVTTPDTQQSNSINFKIR